MANTTRLRHWKGNSDFDAGLNKARIMYNAHKDAALNHGNYLTSVKHKGTHSYTFIAGYEAGIKEQRLSNLLRK